MLKISVSGVRGIWGEDLNHETMTVITKAFIQVLGPKKKIAMAIDTRKSGTAFKMIVSSILISHGYNIIDLGVLATPLTLFAVKHMDLDGGIVLTASHNPGEWNAFKFINKNGLFFNKEEMLQVEKNTRNHIDISFSIKDIGSIQSYPYLFPYYLDFIAPYFSIELIRKKQFTIVADVINGVAGITMPKLFDFLNINGILIHKELNKPFERNPEPKPEYLEALSKKVLEENADLGLAFDPDGDRLSLVNNKGEALDTNWVLIIAYLHFLEFSKSEKKDIVVNYSTSMVLQELALEHDAHIIKTPVGEINVTSTMLQQNIEIGGEGNGGVIYPEINPCRDALVAIFFILDYLSRKDMKLSDLQEKIIMPTSINISIPIGADTILNINDIKTQLEKILASSEHRVSSNTQDGLYIDYTIGWIQVRASNTEPIIRIMGESREEQQQITLVNTIKYTLKTKP